jgi:hypothetical protein
MEHTDANFQKILEALKAHVATKVAENAPGMYDAYNHLLGEGNFNGAYMLWFLEDTNEDDDMLDDYMESIRRHNLQKDENE